MPRGIVPSSSFYVSVREFVSQEGMCVYVFVEHVDKIELTADRLSPTLRWRWRRLRTNLREWNWRRRRRRQRLCVYIYIPRSRWRSEIEDDPEKKRSNVSENCLIVRSCRDLSSSLCFESCGSRAVACFRFSMFVAGFCVFFFFFFRFVLLAIDRPSDCESGPSKFYK